MTHGMNDEEFIRGDVPMTKEEVRSISLSKMKIRKSDIIYDIGAGTGSVSVESAIQAEDGQVYAVEINPEAAGLIEENARKFAVSNIKVIEGSAPEILKDLPAPDCVFIGYFLQYSRVCANVSSEIAFNTTLACGFFFLISSRISSSRPLLPPINTQSGAGL